MLGVYHLLIAACRSPGLFHFLHLLKQGLESQHLSIRCGQLLHDVLNHLLRGFQGSTIKTNTLLVIQVLESRHLSTPCDQLRHNMLNHPLQGSPCLIIKTSTLQSTQDLESLDMSTLCDQFHLDMSNHLLLGFRGSTTKISIL